MHVVAALTAETSDNGENRMQPEYKSQVWSPRASHVVLWEQKQQTNKQKDTTAPPHTQPPAFSVA